MALQNIGFSDLVYQHDLEYPAHDDFPFNGYCDFGTSDCVLAERITCSRETEVLFSQLQVLKESQAVDYLEGNQNIFSSKIVMLPDMHNDHILHLIKQEFLNLFAQENDYVLVEGHEWTDEINSKKQFQWMNVYKNLQFKGWDNKKLLELGKMLTLKLQNVNKHTILERDELYKKFKKVVVDDRTLCLSEKIQKLLPILKENQRIFVDAGIGHLTNDLKERFNGLYSIVHFKEFPTPLYSGILSKNTYQIKFNNGNELSLPAAWFRENYHKVKLGSKVTLQPIMHQFLKAVGLTKEEEYTVKHKIY